MTASLEVPYKRFLRSTSWLLQEFNRDRAFLRSGKIEESSFCLLPEMAVLRLHDDWARFCRELILDSAASAPKSRSGTTIARAPSIRSIQDAIDASIRSTPQRRYEPKWATASESVRAALALAITNSATVTAALGATNSPAEDLRHVRNFFAHRAENTADKVRNLTFYRTGMGLNAHDLLSPIVAGGVTRFESWILQLRTVGDAAIR